MQFLALSVEDLLRGLWGSLCQFFYWLIAWLYDLFINISRVEFLTSENIKPIYQRITMILTIIMVFYVTFEVVKYVIQPEEFSDKEKGASKLVLKMVLVVIMIAFVPQIFSWSYKLQNAIFDNQIFSKVILGKKTANTEEFGRTFSANILGMFYYPDQDTWSQKELEDDAKCEKVPCRNIVTMNLNSLVEYGEIPLMHVGLTSKGKKTDEGTGSGVDKYYIHFDGLFATIVGGFIVYMLVLYCVDAGVRVAQLAFLQIVAPIPIIGYLAPKKDGIFQKWVKQCFTTYLDLFIRVGIIYFVLLLCQILGDAYNSGTLVNNIPGNTSTTMKVFIYIALVMGLLLFAKKAPKMLEELFPKTGAASGNFSLSGKDRFEPAVKAVKGAGKAVGKTYRGAKRVSGAVSGAAMGLASGIRNAKALTQNNRGVGKGFATAYSAVKAAAAGAKAGGSKGGSISKANAAARQSIQKDVAIADKGGTAFGHDALGGYYQSRSVNDQRKISDYQARQKAKDNVASAVKEMKVMKTANSYVADWNQQGIGEVAARTGAMKAIEKASRVYAVGSKDAAAQAVFKDSIKNALNQVYTEAAVTTAYTDPAKEAARLQAITARDKALAEFEANLEIGSSNWETVATEIREAQRVSVGQAYGPQDANGNYTKQVTQSTDIEEFAKEIGDVADAARESEARFKYEEKTRRAQANANSEAAGGKK